MSLTVNLCTNSSPVEKIGKTITLGQTFECLLKADTSILRPTIIVSDPGVNLVGYNYMTIAGFGRSYFIDDIITKNNDIWEISGHVDVLETYGTQILANTAVIKRQAKLFNLYLDDPEFKTLNTVRVQTKKFPNSGFSKNLKYMLVVNGS